MKNKLVIGGLMTLVLGLGMASNAFAYQGDYSKNGPNYTPERHKAMEMALETSNYKAWLELMNGRGRVLQVVNEKNFVKFTEAWKLAREGKVKEANDIRRELGLRGNDGQRPMDGTGRGQGKGQGINRFSR